MGRLCSIFVAESLLYHPSIGYSGGMDKIIRHTVTVTITITESWTIVWSTEAEPLRSATGVVQGNPESQEEQDETHRSAITAADPANLTATPPRPVTGMDPRPGGRPVRSTGGSKRKRARARPAESNP